MECGNNFSHPIIKKQHLIKKHQIYCLGKLNTTELYSMQLILKIKTPTTQTNFEKNFQNLELKQKDLYILPRRVTINKHLWMFQYEPLYSILYLNQEMLYKFGKKGIPTLLFLHGRVWKPNLSFSSFLYENELFLDVDTAFFPKCTYKHSDHTSECNPFIYWSYSKLPFVELYPTYISVLCLENYRKWITRPQRFQNKQS